MAQTFIGYPIITAAGLQLATGAASTSGNIPFASSGEVPKYIRLSATAACCIRLGITGVTANNADTQIQPGDSLIMAVPSGITKIAAIQQSAAGILQISPLENA